MGCLVPRNAGSHQEMAGKVISLGGKEAVCADGSPGCGHPWSWGTAQPLCPADWARTPFENLEVWPFGIPGFGSHARVKFGIRTNQKYCSTNKNPLCTLSHRTHAAIQDWDGLYMGPVKFWAPSWFYASQKAFRSIVIIPDLLP